MPIPINYSVVGYRLSWLGKKGTSIISNLHYKNALTQCGVRDASSFSSYFQGLPSYTGQYYVYSASSGEWTVNDDKNYLPGMDSSVSSFNMANWYFCNAENAYANGCTVSVTRFSSEIQRKLYTYKTTGNAISYDPSRAMDYTDGVSFSFSDPDVMDGLDGYDLDTLMGYLSTLSEEMAEWREQQTQNQETIIGQNKEIIEQNKNLLSAVGGINSTVAKISTNVGKTATLLASIEGYFASLPRDIAEALSDTFPVAVIDYDALSEAMSNTLSEAYTSALPAVLTDVLTDVFPSAGDAIEALIDLPAVIISAVSGVTVKVPDITIPEIKIPEITVPDVFVEAPAITLNPSYDITVANDFTGLEGIISRAVQGVLTDVFVPNEAVTLEKVGEMQEYFQFKDDVINAVNDLKTMIFGITPSPVLKIPIGKTISKKYNYGTGNYIIIDVSWYAPYKQFGDKVILAIVWALFLWRLFLKLPGIISGTEGSIMAADRSYQKYSSGKD